MTKLEFDNEWSRRVEQFNQSPGAQHRRQRILAALQPGPGQRILDVGSGPGHQVVEISAAVGSGGYVCGLDPAEDGIELARQRCRAVDNVEFVTGTVFNLPFEDNSFDAAMSSQVFEYLDDVGRGLAEMHRILKPGGRVLIHDTDWGALLWHTSDADRSQRILQCWDGHLADPHLPRKLGAHLQASGFIDLRTEPIVHLETRFEPNSMSDLLISFIADYVGSQGIDPGVATQWAADLRNMSEAEYFYSSNEYIVTGIKASHR